MADEPSKTPGIPAEHPSPQMIPLSKIHDLPGMFIQKQPDKNYGGLVSSIQASGVKEPVILRLREDGEYQLVAGYRRRRACELAKFKEIPAYVYEMTMKEAREYHAQVNNKPSTPILGKLVNAPAKTQAAPEEGRATEAEKKPEQTALPARRARNRLPRRSRPPPRGTGPQRRRKSPSRPPLVLPARRARNRPPRRSRPPPRRTRPRRERKSPSSLPLVLPARRARNRLPRRSSPPPRGTGPQRRRKSPSSLPLVLPARRAGTRPPRRSSPLPRGTGLRRRRKRPSRPSLVLPARRSGNRPPRRSRPLPRRIRPRRERKSPSLPSKPTASPPRGPLVHKSPRYSRIGSLPPMKRP